MKPVVAKLSAIVSLAPYATAALFTSAALLKVHYLRNYPIAEDGFFHSRTFSTALLETELLLAALLIYPRTRRAAVFISIGLLTSFVVYSVNLWSHGVQICGCLGVLSTKPQSMAAIDTSFAIFLFDWSRQGIDIDQKSSSSDQAPDSPSSIIWYSWPMLALCIAGIMAISYSFTRQSAVASVVPVGIESEAIACGSGRGR